MATLKPRDGVHLVRDLIRAPDFAIAKLLSDGKPRTPMEVYRGMGEFSTATAVAAFARIRKRGIAKPVLAACSEGDALRSKMTVLRRYAKFEPVDAIALRRRISDKQLAAGHYAVA